MTLVSSKLSIEVSRAAPDRKDAEVATVATVHKQVEKDKVEEDRVKKDKVDLPPKPVTKNNSEPEPDIAMFETPTPKPGAGSKKHVGFGGIEGSETIAAAKTTPTPSDPAGAEKTVHKTATPKEIAAYKAGVKPGDFGSIVEFGSHSCPPPKPPGPPLPTVESAVNSPPGSAGAENNPIQVNDGSEPAGPLPPTVVATPPSEPGAEATENTPTQSNDKTKPTDSVLPSEPGESLVAGSITPKESDFKNGQVLQLPAQPDHSAIGGGQTSQTPKTAKDSAKKNHSQDAPPKPPGGGPPKLPGGEPPSSTDSGPPCPNRHLPVVFFAEPQASVNFSRSLTMLISSIHLIGSRAGRIQEQWRGYRGATTAAGHAAMFADLKAFSTEIRSLWDETEAAGQSIMTLRDRATGAVPVERQALLGYMRHLALVEEQHIERTKLCQYCGSHLAQEAWTIGWPGWRPVVRINCVDNHGDHDIHLVCLQAALRHTDKSPFHDGRVLFEECT